MEKKTSLLLKSVLLFQLFLYALYPIAVIAAFRCEHPTYGESPIQTVRNFFWMTVGAPGTSEYNCITSNDATLQSLIPRIGFLGQVESIRSTISSNLRSILGSNKTCDNLPTSGSSNLGSGKTVYYEPAENSIPSNYPDGGGSYQKRLRYVDTNDNITVKFEFNCSEEQMMAKYTKTISADSYFKMVIFYDNSTTTKYVDVYFYDHKNVNSNNRILMALGFRIDSSNNNFQLWQTRTGYKVSDGTNFQAYRFAANVNYSSQATTIFYHDISSVVLNTTNYTGQANINSTSVTGASAPDSGASTDLKQGCATDFNQATAEISSTTACTGLSLNAPPATAFGDTFSIQSVQTNLATRIDAL